MIIFSDLTASAPGAGDQTALDPTLLLLSHPSMEVTSTSMDDDNE